MALFDWPIVLQYDVKAKYRLISRKFSGMEFFHPSVHLTNQKPRALCPFDQPIKSLHSRSFVVSVLFARFHFKVIRKSLYRCIPSHPPFSPIHSHSRYIPFHSIHCLCTVIPFLSIPFTVYFIPIFSILFTVYFQFNFIPFHFTVHYLLNPFPFRSLLSWFHSVNFLPHIHCLFISVPVSFRFNNCHLSFISIKFHSSLWCF